MNLKLTHIKERHIEGRQSYLFSFVDEERRHYRAELSELDDKEIYSRWYNVILGFSTATRHRNDLWLIDVVLKSGTVEIDILKPFRIEIHGQGMAFLPKHKPYRENHRKDTE